MPYLPWNEVPEGEPINELTVAQGAEATHVESVIAWLRAQDEIRFLEERLAIAKREAIDTEQQYDATLAHLRNCGGDATNLMTRVTNIRCQLRDYEIRNGAFKLGKLSPDNLSPKPQQPKPKPRTKSPMTNQVTFHHIVDVIPSERSYHDNRVRVTKTITEYRDANNVDYRKTYETKAPHEATIVPSGTHEEINRKLKQW